MKKLLLAAISSFSFFAMNAQDLSLTDSTGYNHIVVIKDARMDLLDKKVADFNEALANSPRIGRGYRLMLLSTSDRAMAMNLRAKLLQQFPEHKVYMSFQPPYIKIKFGNFLEKDEANVYKDEILRASLVNNNIYVIPENIEIKPDKLKDVQ